MLSKKSPSVRGSVGPFSQHEPNNVLVTTSDAAFYLLESCLCRRAIYRGRRHRSYIASPEVEEAHVLAAPSRSRYGRAVCSGHRRRGHVALRRRREKMRPCSPRPAALLAAESSAAAAVMAIELCCVVRGRRGTCARSAQSPLLQPSHLQWPPRHGRPIERCAALRLQSRARCENHVVSPARCAASCCWRDGNKNGEEHLEVVRMRGVKGGRGDLGTRRVHPSVLFPFPRSSKRKVRIHHPLQATWVGLVDRSEAAARPPLLASAAVPRETAARGASRGEKDASPPPSLLAARAFPPVCSGGGEGEGRRSGAPCGQRLWSQPEPPLRSRAGVFGFLFGLDLLRYLMDPGTWRVGGVLAVSRAFGDKLLKQYVVFDPEIKEEVVDSSLELLILDSDALWDVVTNEEAVAMVKPIQDPEEAAKTLLREASQRGSAHNITIVIVHFLEGGRRRQKIIAACGRRTQSSSRLLYLLLYLMLKVDVPWWHKPCCKTKLTWPEFSSLFHSPG